MNAAACGRKIAAMRPRRPTLVALALLLQLWPLALPVFSLGTRGGPSAHPASCVCTANACHCDHDSERLESCALPETGSPVCGMQGSPCGPLSPHALAWYSLGPCEPLAPLELAPPPSLRTRAIASVTAPASSSLTPIEHPPEPYA